MKAQKLLSFILIGFTVFGDIYAQDVADNNCQKSSQCIGHGLFGMRAQIDRINAINARYGIKSVVTNLVWYGVDAKYSSAYEASGADDRCENCGKGEFLFYKSSWFPRDIKNPIDHRLTDEGKINSVQDHFHADSIAMLTCPSPSGIYISSTFSLYGIEGQKNGNKLIGSAHGLFSEDDIKVLERKNHTKDEIMVYLDRLLIRCWLEVTDDKGNIVEKLKIIRYNTGTLHPTTDPKGDLMVVEIEKSSMYLKRVKIKEVTSDELIGSEVSMVSYHADIKRKLQKPAHGDVFAYLKVKSSGNVMPMHTKNKNRYVKGFVLHNVDSNSMSSGALLYNINDEAVALHSGGLNRDNGLYDGYARYNGAIAFDKKTMSFIKDF